MLAENLPSDGQWKFSVSHRGSSKIHQLPSRQESGWLEGLKEMGNGRICSLAPRDARWGYLLTLQLLVPRAAAVWRRRAEEVEERSRRGGGVSCGQPSRGGTVVSQGRADQRGLGLTGSRCLTGLLTAFVAISCSLVSVSSRTGLCSSGHAEVSLTAVRHSSASWGRG